MNKGYRLLLVIFAILTAAALGTWIGLDSEKQPTMRADVVEALSVADADMSFAQATDSRPFNFPDDFGPHPEFQTEWWYYTGNLKNSQGDRFGYQLTFFRRAVTDTKPDLEGSKWRTSQIYFAHFAVTDIEKDAFYSFEKISREAVGLAGAQADPYRVWIEDWQVYQDKESVRMVAAAGNVSLRLKLKSLKPVVLQGDRGLSQKGQTPGNASYYFSQTRLATEGTIRIAANTHAVSGLSWLDKEWSTSILESGDTGWDWFSIQLEDNRELMLFQIRTETGGINPYSAGSYVDQAGQVTPLKQSDFTITPLTTWKSSQTGITYPAAWKINLPLYQLELQVSPLRNDQEHGLSFIYWEGAVSVSSDTVNGFGYVELTGYEKDLGR